LRDWLTLYKGREATGEAPDENARIVVSALIRRLFDELLVQLSGSNTGRLSVVVVPSSGVRPTPHPIAAALQTSVPDASVIDVLRRGDATVSFRNPTKDGYVATGNGGGTPVLLLDDVYTTGARMNSAAFALAAADYRVACALVLGRRINPAYSPQATALWLRSTAVPFNWQTSPVLRACEEPLD